MLVGVGVAVGLGVLGLVLGVGVGIVAGALLADGVGVGGLEVVGEHDETASALIVAMAAKTWLRLTSPPRATAAQAVLHRNGGLPRLVLESVDNFWPLVNTL